MAGLQGRDLVWRRTAGDQNWPAAQPLDAQATAAARFVGAGDDAVGVEVQNRHRLFRIRNLLQRRLRTTAGKACRGPPTAALAVRTGPARADLAGGHQCPRHAKPDAGGADGEAMIQRQPRRLSRDRGRTPHR